MTDTTKIQVFITDTQGRKGYKVYSPEEYKQKNVAAWLDENYPHQYQVRTIEDVEDGSEIDESASYNVRVEKADGSYAEKDYTGQELAEKMPEFQKRFGNDQYKISTRKVKTYNTAKGPFAAEERARLLSEMAATREKLAEVDKIDMSGEMYNTGLTFKTSRDIDPGKDTVALRKQLEGLQSEYYNLEPVRQQFARGAAEAREANERLAKLWREESGKINMAGEIYNPTPSISHGAEYDYNKTLSDAARRLNNETRKLYEAPSKYDGDPAIKKFFIGAGDRLTDADFWTMGLTEAADYFGLNQVFDKIQKLGGLENLTEEDIESNLTPFESEALGAFFRNMSAQAAREEDLALAYQSGMTAADSIGFMAQFALSGGATAAASKAMGNWIAKKIGKEVIEKAAKKKVLNLAGKAVKGAVETGVQTLLQPHTYANYQRNKYSLEAVSDNPEDGIRLVKNANEALRSYADSYIETLSEKSGTALGWPARWVGKKIGATAWMDALKRTKFGRVANAFFRSDVLNFMKAGGWNGYIGEMGEEFFGDALRTITQVDPEALKNAVQRDNLLIMATSFLPMTMLGGIGGVANYAAVRKEYDLDKAYFQETMRKFNIDESAIQHAIDVAESTHTETPEQLNAVLSPLVDEVVERGGNPTAVFLFARKAAQFQFYRAGDEVRKQMDRETELARLEAEYGGKMVDSEGNVKVAALPDGGTGIVVTSEGGESMVKKADGTIGFVSNTEEDIESIPLNDFLDRSIYARVKAEDDARVEQESAEKVAEAKQKVVPGAAFNNGTEESPMVAEVIEVVGDTANVQMADGSVKPMRISEVAQKMGTDMVVKTREEMEAEMAEALVRGRQIVDQFNSQKMRPVVLNTESGPVEATGIIARVDENGRVFAQVEVQGEEMEVPYEQITLVEAPSVTPQTQTESETVETPAAAAPQTAAAPAGPVDFRGNPLPMRQKKNGEMVVSTKELWNKDHEAWAAYNDQDPNRKVDTRTFLEARLSEVTKTRSKVQKAMEKEILTGAMDEDKIDEYEADLLNIDNRIKVISSVLDKYNKAAEVTQTIGEKQRAAQAEQVKQEAAQNASAVAQKYASSPKVYGFEDEIVLPNGESVRGRYVLVEADAPTASHDPSNGFAMSAGFPVDESGKTVNDRDYERDSAAQQAVVERAAAYDQRALQTPVIVSSEGIVVSGNDRTMSGQLAARNNTDAKYVDYLASHSQKYGIPAEEVGKFQHPRVVFELAESVDYTAAEFAKYNAEEKKSQSKTEKAVKAGK
ncbi:MAG: hypothetical protein II205_04160, partial [Bacteroidales bacterium]|nr:hypothetical protein [Bacteroidales bacterium]